MDFGLLDNLHSTFEFTGNDPILAQSGFELLGSITECEVAPNSVSEPSSMNLLGNGLIALAASDVDGNHSHALIFG